VKEQKILTTKEQKILQEGLGKYKNPLTGVTWEIRYDNSAKSYTRQFANVSWVFIDESRAFHDIIFIKKTDFWHFKIYEDKQYLKTKLIKNSKLLEWLKKIETEIND
jgi:hypothetical protein